MANFRLQILHASDWEAGVDAVDRAGNFAAIVDRLEDAEANSITLSSGDGWIPSPFYIAGGDSALSATYTSVYNQLFGLTGADAYRNLAAANGRADITIQNIIGVEAAALGNHEFDAGTTAVRDIIASVAGGDRVVGTADDGWVGALFPYLSTNLDFSGDGALSGLFTDAIRDAASYDTGADVADASGRKLAPSAIIEENGELIGVIGATTQILPTISSVGGVTVRGGVGDDMALLATQINAEVARLKAANPGLDKIVVQSHLQQIALEQQLAPLLDDVDVIIAGGSNTLLADGDDDLRPGDVAAGDYPIVTQDRNGNTLLIVNTDGEYSYVGRLVVEFDEDGHIVTDLLDPSINGAYATTDETVEELWGADDAFAIGTKGNLVNQVIEGADTDRDGDADTLGVADIIRAQDGNLFGRTAVYLDGRRGEVRTEETNLGNLTADANLAAAKQVDAAVVVSIKNGGGIRDSIGSFDSSGGGTAELPPAANPAAGKDDGDVSQLDIVNSLRFNNALSILTISTAGLLAVVEHGFAAVAPGATPGAFPQIGGMAVSYDPDAPSGNRVQSLAIIDENGIPRQVIVENGELVGNPGQLIKIVTLSFLADGGDGYPFARFTVDRVDLTAEGLPAGDATFAAAGTEQDALAEYLLDRHSETAFGETDTPPAEDERIQNLNVRGDTVLDGVGEPIVFEGSPGDDTIDGDRLDDRLSGGRGDDIVSGAAGDDDLDGGRGADQLFGGVGDDILLGGDDNDLLYGQAGVDELDGGAGADALYGGTGEDLLTGGRGADRLYGADGDDALLGGREADRLVGGAGDDDIDGGGDRDVLEGQTGDDVLTGGSEADVFVFKAGFGQDVVTDFDTADGDLLFFDRTLFANQAAVLAATRQVGADLFIAFDDDNTVTLEGVLRSEFAADDIRIV